MGTGRHCREVRQAKAGGPKAGPGARWGQVRRQGKWCPIIRPGGEPKVTRGQTMGWAAGMVVGHWVGKGEGSGTKAGGMAQVEYRQALGRSYRHGTRRQNKGTRPGWSGRQAGGI